MKDPRYYDIELAAKIGRISRRQAATWARDGILTPSRIYVTDHRPHTHLYSFHDLVAFRVISILRVEYGLTLQRARIAADYIRANSERPWSDLTIWLLDKHVRVSDPNDDSAVRIELAPVAAAVRKDAEQLWQRDPASYGQTEYRRDVMGGTLVVKGTRVSVATIVNMATQGANVEEILRAYPSLVADDIHGVLRQVAEQRRVA
ncbi:MAG: DUF433 domain-containing protein [Thermomicrobiales bacterium]|nr:DUF433 domain-containing protein [Thermomicrobiales bacterium]